MLNRRLQWHLFPYFALLIVAAALGFGWVAWRIVEYSLLEAAAEDLESRAALLDQRLGLTFAAGNADFAELARTLDQTSGVRVTLLLASGQVDADSRGRPEEFADPSTRPEIKRALSGETDRAVRYNPGLETRVLYLAVPVQRGDQVQGVLYLSRPLVGIDHSVSRMLLGIGVVTLLLLALGIPLAWRSARTIAAPLADVETAADRLADGQWGARVAVPETRELAELVAAFNRMADQIQQRMRVLLQHNNEQKAVLASMAEGVLAIDNQERIISMNMASGRLLGLDQALVQGHRLQEVVRNADLSRFVARALAGQDPTEADVLLHGDRQRVMQARGSVLNDSEGRPIGAVVVFNDVTDFRKLENIRRDFVANVSHELKTPVTSIKGFVETLLDGAMHEAQDAERFLRIIAKQADRLHAIIEDLLALSKIEQAEESEALAVEPCSLRGVLENAANACQTGARDRQITVDLQCDPQLVAEVNPQLLEQAVVNLLDNAIKYSEPGKDVLLCAESTADEITIRVADHGPGIAEEHLSRIFERFYRVDRARSRKLGGTGLGLAIVKHIVQAHHGNVTIESAIGVGSTFTIHLPRQIS